MAELAMSASISYATLTVPDCKRLDTGVVVVLFAEELGADAGAVAGADAGADAGAAADPSSKERVAVTLDASTPTFAAKPASTAIFASVLAMKAAGSATTMGAVPTTFTVTVTFPISPRLALSPVWAAIEAITASWS